MSSDFGILGGYIGNKIKKGGKMKEKIEKIPRSWLALWAGLVIYFLMTCLPFATSYSFVMGLFLFSTGFVPGFVTAIIDRKHAIIAALSVYLLVSLDKFWTGMQYMSDRWDFRDCINSLGNYGSDYFQSKEAFWISLRGSFDLTTLAGFVVAALLVWWFARKHKIN